MLVLPECTHPYLFVGFWTFSSSLNSLSSQDVWQNVTSFRIHRAHDHVCNTSIHIHVWKRTYVCLKIKMYTGVAKNRGTTKWMVYNGKPYWDGWFGGTTILGNPHYVFIYIYYVYIRHNLAKSAYNNSSWAPVPHPTKHHGAFLGHVALKHRICGWSATCCSSPRTWTKSCGWIWKSGQEGNTPQDSCLVGEANGFSVSGLTVVYVS